MIRRRPSWLSVACALILAGCGQAASPTVPAEAPMPSAQPGGDVTLPGPDQVIPEGVAGATAWIEMSSQPSGFDPEAMHASPADLADAFGAAIHAAWAGSPERPDLDLEYLEETADRVVISVSETGLGDDSVAGSQYVLIVVREAAGWRLAELWTRALCWRDVSDGDLCV